MNAAPIRVCLLNDHLGWEGRTHHGVSRYFQTTVPRLDPRRVDPVVAILRQRDALERPFTAAAIPLVFLGSATSPFTAWRLLRLLRRRRIQVVHAQGYAGTTLARLFKPLCHSRVLLHSHDDDDGYPRLMSLVDGMLAGLEDAAVANSGDALSFFDQRRRLGHGRTELLHNGLELLDLTPAPAAAVAAVREELDLTAGAEVVLTITRFRPEKGNPVLLRALPALLRRRPLAVVVFAGEGPDLEACRDLAQQLGVADSVRFAGFRDDVTTLLTLATAAVVPSLREGTCYALLESMAMGVPTVASRVGGPSEVIEEGVSGRLVPAGEPEALAAALAAVLGDDGEAARLSAGGRRRATDFDVRHHVERLTAIYEELAGR